MKFLVERSKRDGETTQEVREADSRQEIETQMADENPDMEFTSSDVFDTLMGRKFRSDGTGTDEIVKVTTQ